MVSHLPLQKTKGSKHQSKPPKDPGVIKQPPEGLHAVALLNANATFASRMVGGKHMPIAK